MMLASKRMDCGRRSFGLIDEAFCLLWICEKGNGDLQFIQINHRLMLTFILIPWPWQMPPPLHHVFHVFI
jgi:hypothetical protein